MIRALKVAIVIAVMGAGIAAYGSGAAAAVPTSGQLSATEFKQLTAQLAGIESALGGKNANWSKAYAACRKAGNSSALMKTQREGCLASVGTIRALVKFGTDEQRCAVTSATANAAAATTATTPTTFKAPAPTPGQSAVNSPQLRELACLDSDYQAIGRLAGALYSTDAAALDQASSRGFTGVCLATLAGTAAQVKIDGSFAGIAKSLAADVALLDKVSKGKAPATAIKAATIKRDATEFVNRATKVLNENSPEKLSACPHD